MKTNPALSGIANTPRGDDFVREISAMRDVTAAGITDINASDSTLRFLAGRLSILNELMFNLNQDRR